MKHSFKVGDSVSISSIKQRGVITSFSGKNSVKVSIGSIEVNCKLSEIKQIEAQLNKSKNRQKIKFHISNSKPATSIDLHGYTAESAKEALLVFISNAVVAGYKQISVIHGHGSGTIKRLVHSVISELDVVASFRHPINNSAETKIYLN